jgi:hypothetical protein
MAASTTSASVTRACAGRLGRRDAMPPNPRTRGATAQPRDVNPGFPRSPSPPNAGETHSSACAEWCAHGPAPPGRPRPGHAPHVRTGRAPASLGEAGRGSFCLSAGALATKQRPGGADRRALPLAEGGGLPWADGVWDLSFPGTDRLIPAGSGVSNRAAPAARTSLIRLRGFGLVATCIASRCSVQAGPQGNSGGRRRVDSEPRLPSGDAALYPAGGGGAPSGAGTVT